MKKQISDSKDSNKYEGILTPSKFLVQYPQYKKANVDFLARKYLMEFERVTSSKLSRKHGINPLSDYDRRKNKYLLENQKRRRRIRSMLHKHFIF